MSKKRQTKLHSLLETTSSKILSLIINFVFLYFAVPEVSLLHLTWATFALFGIHFVKSYFHRRIWNKMI